MLEVDNLVSSDLVFRAMVSRDLPEILLIERNAHVSPWSRLSFEESLTRSEQEHCVQIEAPAARDKEPSAEDKEPSARGKKTSARSKKPSIKTTTPQAPYYCRVLEYQNTILGYTIVSSVAGELHVLNIVVSTQAQGAGLGHMLMQDIVDLAKSKGLKIIFLEVRASNHVAQGLYRKWQFEQIAVRRGYYSAPLSTDSSAPLSGAVQSSDREDAFVYMRSL